nr:50S ribosomal protein L29 [bacterium]
MKAKQFHEMSTAELTEREQTLKSELFNLRFQMAIGQLNNPMTIRQCRKDIARVKTILRERELKTQAQ